MTETTRIRWEPTEHGGWGGKVGTLEPLAFEVWRSNCDFRDVVLGEWVLSIRLPGPFGEQLPHGHDPDKLKAEAERWLEEFVGALGAIFEPEPSESAAFQLREARSVLARWDAGRDDPDGRIYDRERVLADQVRALLAIVDQDAAPAAAGTETTDAS